MKINRNCVLITLIEKVRQDILSWRPFNGPTCWKIEFYELLYLGESRDFHVNSQPATSILLNSLLECVSGVGCGRRKIRFVEVSAKCRLLKNGPVKGLYGRCLSEFIDWR